MDISKQYINMCRKAKELQEMWVPREGDWFHDGTEARTIGDSFYMGKWNDIQEIYNRPLWNGTDKPIRTTTWLPRVDQLIEIVMNESHLRDKTAHGITKVQNIYYGDGVFSIMGEHDTIEVAWLKIYMCSKFKSWDGEDWI